MAPHWGVLRRAPHLPVLPAGGVRVPSEVGGPVMEWQADEGGEEVWLGATHP